MEVKHLAYSPRLAETSINLPASKSESNRALIINALAGQESTISNLSEARDTQTMTRLLQSKDEELDVIDAGTTMRFLAAYFAVGDDKKVLTGTQRMQERPIDILVKALNKIGARITYENNPGFPPIKIKPFKRQLKNEIKVRGDQSSQFISALLMIAPVLPEGLTVKIKGPLGSKPYIQMTLDMMSVFGIDYDWTGELITVAHQDYQPYPFKVESDWSGASYWYSLVALAESANIKLLGLRQKSIQGDVAIVSIMNQLGVMSTFEEDGVVLGKIPHRDHFEYDFTDCPDLAQTVAVTCAAKHITCHMTGLESLRIKETDRIKALKRELKKLGAKFKEIEPGVWEVKSKFDAGANEISIDTYDDHRMAMAFAPLATMQSLTIQNPSVVVKSYPNFWNDLAKAGISQS